jgi:hypothetical protein
MYQTMRVVRATSWPEPVRDSEEVLLVDRVQQCDHRPLDDLVLQGRDVGCIMHLAQFGFGDGGASRGEFATQSRSL